MYSMYTRYAKYLMYLQFLLMEDELVQPVASQKKWQKAVHTTKSSGLQKNKDG